MTLKEFREQIKNAKVKPDTELAVHVEDGDFGLTMLEYDKAGKKLKLCTNEWRRQSRYRVLYKIIKDHSEIFDSGEITEFAECDEEMILDFDALKDKILAQNGITGEKNEKSGSTAMEIPDWEYVVEKGVVVRKSTKKTHYFTCSISEILKVVDEENDVYMRVWHDCHTC